MVIKSIEAEFIDPFNHLYWHPDWIFRVIFFRVLATHHGRRILGMTLFQNRLMS
jgi:hypothetical protein